MAYKKSNVNKNNVLNDFGMTCRVCMKQSEDMKSMFQSNTKIVEEIQFCTGILITENTSLPSSICQDCLAQLAVAHYFKTTCIRSEEMFQTLLKDVKVELKCEDISQGTRIAVKEEVDLVYDGYDDVYDVNDFINDTEMKIKKIRRKKVYPRKIYARRPRKGEGKYRKLYCFTCDLQFKTKQESVEHKDLLHKNEVQCWVCEVCGKQFALHASYHSHVRVHAPPDLACAHCDYTSVRKSDLAKHLRTHSGEKKFQCHFCSNVFRTSSNLHGHIQRNHGGHKTHHCDKCEMAFYTRHKLNRHLDSHNNIKRYECEVCHSCFTRRAHWRAHLQKQHAISTPPLRPGRRRTSDLLHNLYNQPIPAAKQ